MQSDNMATLVQFLTVAAIAESWGCSAEKVARELEQYRGRDGFMDLGVPARRYRRKKAILRIRPDLLVEIERNRNGRRK